MPPRNKRGGAAMPTRGARLLHLLACLGLLLASRLALANTAPAAAPPAIAGPPPEAITEDGGLV